MSSEEIRRDVEDVCSFAARGAGTDAERRLSDHLAERLRDDGMVVDVEPTYCHPRSAANHLLHCALALAGGIVAVYLPVAGFAMVLLVAVSAYFDLNGRFYLLRRLQFRRASQNVYAAPADPPLPTSERLVLCAHVDAPRGNARPGISDRALAPLARKIPWLSGSRTWFWAVALLLVPIGIRAGGVEAVWVSVLQILPMLVLIVACFALGDRVLAPLRPGADDNASGVAAALAAHRALTADPPECLRVEVLLLGSGAPTMEGMREFLRAHAEDLERRRTRFLTLERVAAGEPCFLVAQGPAVSMPVDLRMVEACRAAVAGESAAGEAASSRALRDGSTSAAHVARVHRYPSVLITGGRSSDVRPDSAAEVDPAAVESAAELAVAVVRRIDREQLRAGGDVARA